MSVNYEFQPFILYKAIKFHIHHIFRTQQFMETPNYNNFTKICVFRDPIERFLSCYQDKVSREKLYLLQLNKKDRDRFQNLTIDEFFEHLDELKIKSKIIRDHISNQTENVGTDPGYFDKVFLFDQLEELNEFLDSRYGDKLSHINLNKEKKKLNINNELHLKLKEYFKEDLEFYGKAKKLNTKIL